MAHAYTASQPAAPPTAPAPGGDPKLQPADAPFGRGQVPKNELRLGFLDLVELRPLFWLLGLGPNVHLNTEETRKVPRLQSRLQHLVRLRKTVINSDRLKADLRLDFSIKQRASKLLAMLSYELRRNGRPLAVLRATPYELVARKSWPVATPEARVPKTGLTIPRCSGNLHAIAGLTYDGRPSFGLDIDEVKPMGLIVVAALGLLALGKPLSQSRAFEVIQFSLPQNGLTHAKVEGRCTVQKHGRGLKVGVNQINPVLRL